MRKREDARGRKNDMERYTRGIKGQTISEGSYARPSADLKASIDSKANLLTRCRKPETFEVNSV